MTKCEWLDMLEIDFVNGELREMADEAVQAQVQMVYDEMIENLSREYWMAESASHAYDMDAIAYGEMF